MALAVLLATTTFVGFSEVADAAARNVTTFAGTGVSGHLDETGGLAQFANPSDTAVDSMGNVFVSEYTGWIRKISPAGVVTTFAGDGTVGYQNGAGNQAKFTVLRGLDIDSFDNLYVADQDNHVIRKITPTGVAYRSAARHRWPFDPRWRCR